MATSQEMQSTTDASDNAARDSCSVSVTSASFLLRNVAVVLFIVQVVTGLLLMTAYSPSTTTAWGSVWYIQTQMRMGWLIRGLHHVASDALLLTLLAYAAALLIKGGYRSVRLWWAALILLFVALLCSLTGELLPWDQAGYWGTTVRLNILASTPVVGDALRRLVVGGVELGNLTLARFHALHVIVLPAIVGVLVFRGMARHRVTAHESGERAIGAADRPLGSGAQLLGPALGLLVVAALFAVVGILHTADAGAFLAAPADPNSLNYPARPEWHTLFLFEWLKFFETPTAQVVGAIVVPSLVAQMFFLYPLTVRILPGASCDRWLRRFGGLTLLVVLGLTGAALWDDRPPSVRAVEAVRAKQVKGEPLNDSDQHTLRAEQFRQQRERAERFSARSLELAARDGIPPGGALDLLRNDAQTQGPLLFAANCAACHRLDGHDGLGIVPVEPAASSDLAGYGTRTWIRGFLDDPMNEAYFGRMTKPDGEPAHTKMSKWLAETRADAEAGDTMPALLKNFDAVAAYLEDESRRPGRLSEITAATAADPPASGFDAVEQLIRHGRRFFMTTCNECHSYEGEREGTFRAPEMYGYGSVAWIELMIAEPGHQTRYRTRGREPAQMPAFRDRLSELQRNLLARWIYDQGHSVEASTGNVPNGDDGTN